MKVLVAGPSGALGIPTVRELVARGHEVYGLTRSEAKAEALSALGARAVIGDVLKADEVERVCAEVQPEGVLQLLNAIPKRGAIRPSDLDATNELRTVGTRHLLRAAIRNGTRRYVVESMIFGYGYGDRGERKVTEDAPFGEPVAYEKMNAGLQALKTMEQAVSDATAAGEIEGVVLRLGLFYGPGVGSTEFMISMLRKHLMFLPDGGKGLLSWIHVSDGARACVDALERAPAGAIYNVVDDEPAGFGDHAAALARALDIPGPKSIPAALVKPVSSYLAEMANTNLRASNEKIKRELGWSARFPTIKEGAADIARNGLEVVS